MEYFVGNWSLQGTTKISPNSPPAEFTGKEQSAWTPGGYFVETHTDIHGPLGDVRSTRVMEYNPASHVYLYNVYNSLGEHIVALGHLDRQCVDVEGRAEAERSDRAGALHLQLRVARIRTPSSKKCSRRARARGRP